MTTIDLKKTYRSHYAARREPEIVEVPERLFLMIDGAGDPNRNPAYGDAVAALFPLAYGLRAAIKEETGIAYTVMPLEALWWVDDWATFNVENKSNWQWTAMICQPQEAGRHASLLPAIAERKKLVTGDKVRLDSFGDGLAAQILHRGPYAEEAPTIEALHTFIDDHGYELRDKHHELYLTDPRKGDPAKTRTIIRQPIKMT